MASAWALAFFGCRLLEVSLRPSFILVHEYPYAIMLKTEEEEVYNESRRIGRKIF